MTVTLEQYSLERCHQLWSRYVPDPDMTREGYAYNREAVERYHAEKTGDSQRRLFAVCLDGEVIGEISLKRLDLKKGCATMSIVLACDKFKGKGYGTEAERLLLDYAFGTLGLGCVYADTVLRNKKSQRVLEKVGFIQTHSDGEFCYYRIEK